MLRTILTTGIFVAAMAVAASAAERDEGASTSRVGGHGDVITWPCPKPTPTA